MQNRTNKQWLSNPIRLIACGLGSGLLPKMPGTWGTLLAVPLCYYGFDALNKTAYQQWTIPILLLLFLLGIGICQVVNRQLSRKDAPQIVIDEIVGYAIAVSQLPIDWRWYAMAFVLFRFFDIAKPFPIRLVDKYWHNGFGIMFDDALAGLATCGILILFSQP